jgi:RNA polymerase sigma factor (sigma-70 family)
MGTFAGDCTASTWLFAIARNTCLDRLRARGVRSRSFESLEALIRRVHDDVATPGVSTAPDVGVEAERRWYVEAVREGCLLATLQCLSDDQRAAFVLRILCQMSTRDTATVLERSENAVRVLTHRARQALKGFLCRHCSVYEPANTCRCRNLVGFSLAQGWIGPDDRRLPRDEAAMAAARTSAAISDVATLATLYSSVADPGTAPELAARVRADLRALNRDMNHPDRPAEK